MRNRPLPGVRDLRPDNRSGRPALDQHRSYRGGKMHDRRLEQSNHMGGLNRPRLALGDDMMLRRRTQRLSGRGRNVGRRGESAAHECRRDHQLGDGGTGGNRRGKSHCEIAQIVEEREHRDRTLAVLLSEPSPRAEQERFHGRLRDLHLLRYGRVAEPVDFAQQKNALMAVSQLAEGLSHRLVFFMNLDTILRRLGIQRERDRLVIRHRACALPGAIGIDRKVARNAEEPAPEGRPGLKRVDSGDGTRQGLLTNVLGIFACRHQMTAEPIQRVTMPP